MTFDVKAVFNHQFLVQKMLRFLLSQLELCILSALVFLLSLDSKYRKVRIATSVISIYLLLKSKSMFIILPPSSLVVASSAQSFCAISENPCLSAMETSSELNFIYGLNKDQLLRACQ